MAFGFKRSRVKANASVQNASRESGEMALTNTPRDNAADFALDESWRSVFENAR